MQVMGASYDLISFDVFDTLLTRAVGSPSSLFILLGRMPEVQGITRCTPEEFARIRIDAERRARPDLGEATLERIYLELSASLSLEPQQAKELLQAELQLEHRLSRSVPSARELLAAERGNRRVAISDIYLPTPEVDALLDRHGLREQLDRVYVSSDVGVRKGTGHLFHAILKTEEVSGRRWCHVGDDVWSDYKVPRALGIAAQSVHSARLNRFENIWESHRWDTSGLSSLFAGGSRLARLTASDFPAEEPVVRVAAGVAAPALTSYVLWVLNRAVSEGIDRLYFLARDGEILYQIAQRLCSRLGISIELRYLYGSRYAFRRATAASAPIATAAWLFEQARSLSNVEALSWIGLDERTARTTLHRNGLPFDCRTPDLIAQLEHDELFVRDAVVSAEQARELASQYLAEQGLCDDVSFAVVDTGWSGRLLQAMHELLLPLGSGVSRAFFMAYQRSATGDDFHAPEAISGYLYDERQAVGYHEARKSLWWLAEAFCVAEHGLTVGFERVTPGAAVTPLLASERNPALEHWPWWHHYRRAVYRFVEQSVWDSDVANLHADMRPAVVEVLDELWSRPDDAESATWGLFPFEQDPIAGRTRPLARPIGHRDFGQRLRGSDLDLVWGQASLRLTQPGARPLARWGLLLSSCFERRRLGAPVFARHWRERYAVLSNGIRCRLAWTRFRGWAGANRER